MAESLAAIASIAACCLHDNAFSGICFCMIQTIPAPRVLGDLLILEEEEEEIDSMVVTAEEETHPVTR